MLKFPLTFLIPAASKLLPFLSAFKAPSSIIRSPLGEIELIIHFFLASNFEIFGKNENVYSGDQMSLEILMIKVKVHQYFEINRKGCEKGSRGVAKF